MRKRCELCSIFFSFEQKEKGRQVKYCERCKKIAAKSQRKEYNGKRDRGYSICAPLKPWKRGYKNPREIFSKKLTPKNKLDIGYKIALEALNEV